MHAKAVCAVHGLLSWEARPGAKLFWHRAGAIRHGRAYNILQNGMAASWLA